MRQIKFRCWDLEKLRMFIPRNMCQVPKTGMWISSKNVKVRTPTESGYVIGTEVVHFESKPCNEMDREDTKTFVLMQYTGLKDKNGVEIYELHKVKAKLSHNVYIENYVEFHNGCFCIGNIPFNVLSDFEIIGDFYENPNLLEEEK